MVATYPPTVINWTLPGRVSDIVPLKLLATMMVENSKASRLRLPLKSPAQVAFSLSLFDGPPLIVVVAGRFLPEPTLMLNPFPVVPPEPRRCSRRTDQSR